MDLTNIYVIIGEILAAAFVALVHRVAVQAKAWLEAKTDAQTAQNIIALVEKFVKSADEQLKVDDPTGEKRKQYVTERIEALGYEMTDTIKDYVESAVFDLGHTKK